MRNINLKRLWNEESKNSQELDNLAFVLFGDRHQIIFDRFILGTEETPDGLKNSLIDTVGEHEFTEKILGVCPLIYNLTNEIAGYMIYSQSLIGESTRLKKKVSQSVKITDLDSFMSMPEDNKNPTNKVINPDGTLGTCEIVSNGSNKQIKFKGDIFIIHFEDYESGKINCCTSAKKGG